MKSRSPRRQRNVFENFLANKLSPKKQRAKAKPTVSKPASPIRHHNEAGIMTETALKLFVGLFVSLVASISLVRLIPYHFAQSIKLQELQSQVKETEYRVKSKKRQLMKNFDSQQSENLREEYSSRINKNKIRLFLRNQDQSER